ncbi:head decoration protein [Lelliottia aquatilis]|nr:head decoration protein [Lelliottia aquatilis]NTZ48393.1 head decoration protein [Lelliottia aquatilis]POZ13460.1 head decoration protein [Lelliottia aquatilis]
MVEVIGDNPCTPGMQSYTYVPDQLIAGNLQLVTDTVDIGGANPLVRGTILGQITATGVYVLSVQTATDGSEVPSAVLVDNVTPGGATVRGGIYELGIFNQNRITFDSSWTIPALKTALRPFSIFLRDSLQAPAS